MGNMKHIIGILLISIVLFTTTAQPAMAAEPQRILFEETPIGQSYQYFNPENATPLPVSLGLTDGVYYGPQYPFATLKLDIRDVTTLYLNFTLDIPYQYVMNGVWNWKFLLPMSITDSAYIYLDGNGTFPVSHESTDYGELYEMVTPLFPGVHTFSIRVTTSSSVLLYLAREHQPANLTVIGAGKSVYSLNLAYAFLFKHGFGLRGMGALSASKLFLLLPGQTGNYTTVGLPLWAPAGTQVNISMWGAGFNGTYVERTISSAGFYYIFQSTPHRNETGQVFFQFNFTHPVKLLFCAQAQSNPYTGITYVDNHLVTFAIVRYQHDGDMQVAFVQKQGDFIVYDFGFARTYMYTTGAYAIHPAGNYNLWVEVRDVTVKSLGAKVDEILFNGSFEFGADNSILSYLENFSAAIKKQFDQIKEMLSHIGEIVWQLLMKFWKFIVSVVEWIEDYAVWLLQYGLLVLTPVTLILMMGYASRFAKGVRA